jgi:hypothetical protein
MNINLDDKLVEELDSLFDNKRNTQTEWDACIEDIVEEYIARQNGTWEDDVYEEDEEDEDVYFDLRNLGLTNGTNGTLNGKNGTSITKPPFNKNNLPNRFRGK